MLVKLSDWIKAKIGKFLGMEPYIRLSKIERNLLKMGYPRKEARKIIYAYRIARKS